MASNLGAYFCSSLVRSSSAAPSPISRASVSFKARAPARLADETHDPSLYFTRGEAWPASELSLFSRHRQHDLEEALLIRLGNQRGKVKTTDNASAFPLRRTKGDAKAGKMEARARCRLCRGTGA
jgi:hypothetical protein